MDFPVGFDSQKTVLERSDPKVLGAEAFGSVSPREAATRKREQSSEHAEATQSLAEMDSEPSVVGLRSLVVSKRSREVPVLDHADIGQRKGTRRRGLDLQLDA